MDTSSILSIFAILISATTAWFTFFHKGSIKMTQPNFMAIIPHDGLSAKCPKFFFRALLYSTSKRGRAVESMFIKINRNRESTKFQYWAYGERERLVPGSGMFVGSEGYEANHHFTPIEKDATYDFGPGSYFVDIFGKIVGSRTATLLKRVFFNLNQQESEALKADEDIAVFLWWDVEEKAYLSKIDKRPR